MSREAEEELRKHCVIQTAGETVSRKNPLIGRVTRVLEETSAEM